MAKKPPTLTVIGPRPAPNSTDPPSTLREAGRKLWSNILADYEIDDSAGLEMLFQICSSADRADEFASAIERDGAVIRTKGGGVRDHPLIRHEVALRSFVVRSLHRLNLDVIPPRSEVGRPSGDYRGQDR